MGHSFNIQSTHEAKCLELIVLIYAINLSPSQWSVHYYITSRWSSPLVSYHSSMLEFRWTGYGWLETQRSTKPLIARVIPQQGNSRKEGIKKEHGGETDIDFILQVQGSLVKQQALALINCSFNSRGSSTERKADSRTPYPKTKHTYSQNACLPVTAGPPRKPSANNCNQDGTTRRR